MSGVMDKLPWLGASVKRKEDDRLLRGSGLFLDDVDDTLALHVAIGRCPYPHARIRAIDVSRALDASGVEAVLVGEQVMARTEPITLLRPFPGTAPTLFYGMAHAVARYEGEPVTACGSGS
jgi:aerobic carbon-monoxide dehydrogenase large subunit